MAEVNTHVGSDLYDFLAEKYQLGEATAIAVKRIIAWQISEAMEAKGLTKKVMAERMHTSRSQLDRLVNEKDMALTLDTLSRTASVPVYRLRIELTV